MAASKRPTKKTAITDQTAVGPNEQHREKTELKESSAPRRMDTRTLAFGAMFGHREPLKSVRGGQMTLRPLKISGASIESLRNITNAMPEVLFKTGQTAKLNPISVDI